MQIYIFKLSRENSYVKPIELKRTEILWNLISFAAYQLIDC